jgi:hypothetical protein
VAHITGARFALLNTVSGDNSSLDKTKAWEKALHLKTEVARAIRFSAAGGWMLLAKTSTQYSW